MKTFTQMTEKQMSKAEGGIATLVLVAIGALVTGAGVGIGMNVK